MIFSVSLLWVAGGSIAPVLAGDESRVVEVTGVGETHQAAKEDAIRNAVEKVVGAYVSSDLATQNHQLIKDEVLNYSGGYVEKIDILSQERGPDGLYVTKVRALVINNKVRRKLEKINVSTRDLPSESLFAEAFSKVDEQKKSAQLISKVMEKYPSAAFVAEVGPPKIVSTDHQRNLVMVEFVATVSWDPIFIGEFKEVLAHVSKEGDPICFSNMVVDPRNFPTDCSRIPREVMPLLNNKFTGRGLPPALVDILFSINDSGGNAITAVRNTLQISGFELESLLVYEARNRVVAFGGGFAIIEGAKAQVTIPVKMGINDLQRATKTQITFHR